MPPYNNQIYKLMQLLNLKLLHYDAVHQSTHIASYRETSKETNKAYHCHNIGFLSSQLGEGILYCSHHCLQQSKLYAKVKILLFVPQKYECL